MQANGGPSPGGATPPLEGNRFVKTFVIPRLDRGNQVKANEKEVFMTWVFGSSPNMTK